MRLPIVDSVEVLRQIAFSWPVQNRENCGHEHIDRQTPVQEKNQKYKLHSKFLCIKFVFDW